jgi:hypothetical protein
MDGLVIEMLVAAELDRSIESWQIGRSCMVTSRKDRLREVTVDEGK